MDKCEMAVLLMRLGYVYSRSHPRRRDFDNHTRWDWITRMERAGLVDPIAAGARRAWWLNREAERGQVKSTGTSSGSTRCTGAARRTCA
jgi:hypothetical protein